MFRTTFIGHQGWLFSSGEATILVDPLLCEEFGQGGFLGRAWPPRRVDVAAFPPIDAVILSHEHEDHFNVPALHRLEREIPIYLSARSSTAGRRILAEMGFQVSLYDVGQPLTFGELELTAYGVNNVGAPNGDEWDVMPYLVRHVGGDGSFFSAVDVDNMDDETRGSLEAAVRERIGRPGLWCYTNNSVSFSYLRVSPDVFTPADTARMAAETVAHHVRRRQDWEEPVASLFCGGGWCFAGDHAWMNGYAFPADSERICASLSALFPGHPFIAATPGQTVVMSGGALVEVQERTPFLSALPRAEWPARELRPDGRRIERYEPACGERRFSAADLDELLAALARFATHLYGRDLFAGLYSIRAGDGAPRRPAFVLSLLADDGGPYALEYEPQNCGFARVQSRDPIAEYVIGMECWASDLLAFFRGDMTNTGIFFGRMREWNFLPERVRTLASYVFDNHPLRRPEVYLNAYRRLYQAEPPSVPRVPAARGRLTRRSPV